MASLFTSLSRTAIATIFSEAVLQSCQHQLPQALTAITAHRNIITSLQVGPLSHNFLRFSTIAGSLLTTSMPLPSLFSANLIHCQPLHFVPSHQKTLAHFYCNNWLLARNSTSNTQRTTLKVPAPHQGCSTALRGSEGTDYSSSTSSDHQSWYVSNNFCPVTNSTVCKTSIMKTSILSHAYQVTLKLWWQFYCWNWLLATNSTSDTQRTTPKVPALLQGWSATHRRTLNGLLQHLALLLIADADALLTTSAPLPGPFSWIFSALPLCYDCCQTSLTWQFTL